MTDLFRVAGETHVSVEYMRLPRNRSMSVNTAEGDYILMDYSLIAATQERVHLAHELGHCLTGSFYNPYALLDIRRKHEYRANKWAVRHLVPEAALIDAISHGIDTRWELAEMFEVTEDFIVMAVEMYGLAG